MATAALRPGDLILAEPTLAFAINDALVRKRCAVTGCATDDITCAECANVEHYCDGIQEGGETRLARLVAAARARDREGLAGLVSHLDDVDDETLEFATYAASLARQWWPLSAKCSSERALEDVLRCHCNAFSSLKSWTRKAKHVTMTAWTTRLSTNALCLICWIVVLALQMCWI